MKIYVDAKASRQGNGSKEMPFKHINDAAQVAVAGDEVLVAPGIYREYVNPRNAGTEDARIVYPQHRAFRGSDHRSRGSKRLETLSGNYLGNQGQQFHFPEIIILILHMYTAIGILPEGANIPGAVYLNDKMLYEAESLEACNRRKSL